MMMHGTGSQGSTREQGQEYCPRLGKDRKPLGADGGSTVESDYIADDAMLRSEAPLPKPNAQGKIDRRVTTLRYLRYTGVGYKVLGN